MELHKAGLSDLDTVMDICRITIGECYGRYYPKGGTEYFLEHHNEAKVRESVTKGEVYLLYEDKEAVGTVSVTENYIHRLFVLPGLQGRGYGTHMMDFLENELFKKYDEIKLDSSLVSFNMYSKRGYTHGELVPYSLTGGNVLCYFPMTKKRI